MVTVHMYGNYPRLGKEPPERIIEYNTQISEKAGNVLCSHQLDLNQEGVKTSLILHIPLDLPNKALK